MTQVLFIIFGLLAIVAALCAVTRRNPVASAMWLIVMFFGMAGCYVVLEAFFVAAVQVLVYAGAIMVLFLFVIMLLDLRTEEIEKRHTPLFKFFGVMSAILFATVAVLAIIAAKNEGALVATNPIHATDSAAPSTLAELPLDGSAHEIGRELFTRWLLPFEVVSLLLLGAILGAVILTKRRLT